MAHGVTLVILVGFCWSLTGVLFSRAAARGLNFFAFLGAASFISAALSWTFLADHHALLAGGVPGLFPLAPVMIASGVLNSIGIVCLNRAMRGGHHGTAWTITQSALVIPFLCGVVLFGGSVSAGSGLEVLLVLVSLLLLVSGVPASRAREKAGPRKPASWLPAALFSFLLLGAHQTLTTVPSYWQNWSDAAGLRPPLLYSGIVIGYARHTLVHRRSIDGTALLFASILSAVGIFAQVLLYRAMDLLAPAGLLPIVYPLAVSTAIISFAVYSIFLIREKISPGYLAGIGCGISGLLLIALRN